MSTVLGTAVLGATLALSVPAAHAAPADTSAACSKATTAANKAEAAFDAALASFKAQVKAGGHPGAAEQQNLATLQNDANLATSDAVRVCRATKSPVGTVHTGVGSTSNGTATRDLALGGGLIAAVALGAVALRRRNNAGDQA
ncbi:hypothetical protein [Streptacidiphilus carbonis]|uniref:hypothetical protein n=1 Tax=Streptacidiphilus carbonis TaxID=105422 RepID=UPI00126A2222|nr:hypothetical protein [Streptacidiphilus carbonis]